MFCSLAAPAFAALFSGTVDPNGLVTDGYFLGIPVEHIKTNWMTSGLCNQSYDPNTGNSYAIGSPLGQMFGVILACTLAIWLDKGLRRIIPTSLSLFFVPVLTVLGTVIASLFLIIPVSGYVIFGISWFFQNATHGY